MKKLKQPRGFYKELRLYYGKYRDIKKTRRINAIEYWLKHLYDKSKDIRFYAKWNCEEDIQKSLDYICSISKENYEDSTLIRLLETPRTRKEKAIHKCRLSLIPHISKIQAV